MLRELIIWNTKTKTYENKKVKLKGAFITGNVLDIIEIILIIVIIMSLLSICGLTLTNLFDTMGTALGEFKNMTIELIF